MKPTAVLDMQVSGNLTGERVQMTIDETATAHLMSVLTNLYSNQIEAVCREYATNAFDANRERWGAKAPPVEVTLPNAISPFFTVKDRGFGLSVEDIRHVYSKYGASTKRDSDLYNGMFGIGAKSALTYTPNFTVISVRDGMRASVSVSMNPDGVGEMEIVDVSSTTEDSGTTIQIPVKRDDRYTFQETCQRLYGYWPSGTVTVNGVPAKRHDFVHVKDNVYSLGVSGDGHRDVIVMGNVAYPLPDGKSTLDALPAMVYFAEIGDVVIAPNREALINNSQTRAVVEEAIKTYESEFFNALQKRVDSQPSRYYAWMLSSALNHQYDDRVIQYTYKGEDIPGTPTAKVVFRYQGEGATVQSTMTHFASTILGGWYRKDEQSVMRAVDSIILVTDAPTNMHPSNRKKLREAAADKFSSSSAYYELLVGGTEEAELVEYWSDGIKHISWAEVLEHYAKNRVKTSRSLSGMYEMYDANGHFHTRQVEDGEKYLYASPVWTGIANRTGGAAIFWLPRLGYDYLIVTPENRHAKLARTTGAVSVLTAARKYGETWFSSLSDEKRFSMTVYRNNESSALRYDPKDVLCERTRKILTRYDAELANEGWGEYNGLRDQGVQPNMVYTDDEHKVFPGMPRTILNMYGLNESERLEILNALTHYRKETANVS